MGNNAYQLRLDAERFRALKDDPHWFSSVENESGSYRRTYWRKFQEGPYETLEALADRIRLENNTPT